MNNSMTFEEILLEAIDESLICLGEQTKKAVYLYLKNTYSLNKHELPYRMEDFKEALEDTFQEGAKLLEIKIMKILYSKVSYGHIQISEPESWEFISYVYELRNSVLCHSSSPAPGRPQIKCGI